MPAQQITNSAYLRGFPDEAAAQEFYKEYQLPAETSYHRGEVYKSAFTIIHKVVEARQLIRQRKSQLPDLFLEPKTIIELGKYVALRGATKHSLFDPIVDWDKIEREPQRGVSEGGEVELTAQTVIVDCTVPLIFSFNPLLESKSAYPQLIDGWHRLAKAKLAGNTWLAAYVLTADEWWETCFPQAYKKTRWMREAVATWLREAEAKTKANQAQGSEDEFLT